MTALFASAGFGQPEWSQHPNWTNKGIVGQNSNQILARFQTDVIDLKPSVVVIQDTDMVAAALPVQHRRLVALPMQSPVISAVSPAMASVGQLLTLTGIHLSIQSAAILR